MTAKDRTPGLTGNQLKILAMIFMTCDHVGLQLLPQVGWLRIVGRLSMPIYAYMIAEGCAYTRDKKKYLLRLLGLGAACQAVYFIAMGSLYMCILMTFSLSVGVILLAEGGNQGRLRLVAAVLGAYFLCEILPALLPGTDFAVDYGIWGVLLPVLIYFGRSKGEKLALFTLGVVMLALAYGGAQWWGLGTVPLLALYNGQRGKYAIGKLFYYYYPLHLVAIYGLSLVL